MKKRLYITLTSITAVMVCSYFLTGKLIQQSYYDTVAHLNTQPDVKVSLISYDRGLFHSHANIKVTADSKEIPLQQTITHGPIIVANTPNGFRIKFLASQLKTTFDEEWQQKLKQYTENNNPLTITTLIDFSKQAETWLSLTALDQTSENKLHLKWAAITGNIKHDLEFNTYNGSIDMPEVTVGTEAWNVSAKAIVFKIESVIKDKHFSHNNSIETKSLVFARADKELIKLDDITTNLKMSNSADGNLALNFNANVSNSQIAQQKFAQDNFKLQVNNLNRVALQNMPKKDTLTLQELANFGQQVTAESSELTIELPKHFTEALLSYVSFELYKGSVIGQYDQREEALILKDITASINNLFQGALKEKVFVEQGAYYTFKLPDATPAPAAVEAPKPAEPA